MPETLRDEMYGAARTLIGSGYVPDYYEQAASEFIRIAESHATRNAVTKEMQSVIAAARTVAKLAEDEADWQSISAAIAKMSKALKRMK
jgi:hypothetical protein